MEDCVECIVLIFSLWSQPEVLKRRGCHSPAASATFRSNGGGSEQGA